MDYTAIQRKFISFITEDNVFTDVPMREHTSFKVGGMARVMVLPSSAGELIASLNVCKECNVPYVVMGNGTNLLFRDEGYDGVIIKIGKNLRDVEIRGDSIFAESGALLSAVAGAAYSASLSGMEFAAGIPGSIGGAVFMNAGAYGGELKDILERVIYLDGDGNIAEKEAKDLCLGYRHSIFQETKDIILACTLKLERGDQNNIGKRMKELNKMRNSKQPVTYPCAGSIFKRPEGYYAGKLIEDAGLKGLKLGGARVSTLHSGFIINENNATASDIINLIELVKNTVKDKTGVSLEPEVRIIG